MITAAAPGATIRPLELEEMQYLTDGVHLYEIAAQRAVENAGCFWRSQGRYGKTINYTVIRDCVSEAVATLGDLDLAALTQIPDPR